MRKTRKELDDLSYKIIGAAMEINRHLGPGLLESVYRECLAIELRDRKLSFSKEFEIPIKYKGHHVQGLFRGDFFCREPNCGGTESSR